MELSLAIVLLIYSIDKCNKLIKIVEGNKFESSWKLLRVGYFTFLFLMVVILLTRLIDTRLPIAEYWATGAPHSVLMNSGFLLSSSLLLIVTIIDRTAFSSLLTIISDTADYLEKAKIVKDFKAVDQTI